MISKAKPNPPSASAVIVTKSVGVKIKSSIRITDRFLQRLEHPIPCGYGQTFFHIISLGFAALLTCQDSIGSF